MQDRDNKTIERVIFKTRKVEVDPDNILEECIVFAIDGGGVQFTRPTFDNGATKWGPAPYKFSTLPSAGDSVLIGWVSGRPWALSWWPV